MTHAVSLINESKLLSYVPVEGAEISYCRIGTRRYQDLIRECRIEDRGPLPVDKEAVRQVVSEVLKEDGTLRANDEAGLANKIYGLLIAALVSNKTDWNAVKVRTLLWAIRSWSGIGFNEVDGEAAIDEESVSAFAGTPYGDELFQLVLIDLAAQKAKEASDPLGRSGVTSNSASNSAGATAAPVTKATRKTDGHRPVSRTKKGTASTLTRRRSS